MCDGEQDCTEHEGENTDAEHSDQRCDRFSTGLALARVPGGDGVLKFAGRELGEDWDSDGPDERLARDDAGGT